MILFLAMLAATAGPVAAGQVERVETAIRDNLAAQGSVEAVEMGAADDGTLTGFATLHDAQGRQGRFTCNARPATDGGFDWHCYEQVDALVIARLEDNIRQSLSQQGEVLEVELVRLDDDSADGHARLRGADGVEVRMDCSAARHDTESIDFDWNCDPST